jgi:hypothetical protein
VEGTIAKKLSFLAGVRYKTNSYLVKGLDTKGDYKPRFFDVQGMLNYEINPQWELSILGIYSDNSYKLTPQSRETSFGTISEAYRLQIYFDGHEADSYQSWLSALTLSWKPSEDLRLRLIGSVFGTYERETYDISGEYWIGKLETFQGSSDYGQVTEIMGAGAYFQHARNYLDGKVYSVEHRGQWDKQNNEVLWGLKYQYENFSYRIREYELRDSAGYTLPRPPDDIGSLFPPHDSLKLSYSLQSVQHDGNSLASGFLQDTWTYDADRVSLSVTGLSLIHISEPTRPY